MPELPEVETTRRGITPHIKGQLITHTMVRNAKLRWPVSPEILQLKNCKIEQIDRRAKYLLFQLERGWIVIHLGMSGRIAILDHAVEASKHDHIDLFFGNGKILRYTDPRRFGSWLWVESLDQCTSLNLLGPEPLSDDFTVNYLFELSRNKKKPIKSWLMDNHIVVGVGNIYANEALFKSHILPQRHSGSLSYDEISLLVSQIKLVLTKAIEQGGTTLKDFLQSDGKPGYFAQELDVYGRGSQPCIICQHPIKVERIAQRSSFYCSYCQS